MFFKISNSFFYTQKVAYFLLKDSSSPVKASNFNPLNPTYLRCIADQTRSKYDQPTLYRRPQQCTPAQHTTCGERDHPRSFFDRLKKTYPAHNDLLERARPTPAVFKTNIRSPTSSPAHCRSVYFSRAGESVG